MTKTEKRSLIMENSTDLAERIRRALPEGGCDREVKMFGGLAFMHDDRMIACISRDGGLLARIAPERDAELVRRPGARRAEMGEGRSMGTGWIAVDLHQLDSEEELRFWVDACLDFHAQGSLTKRAK
ncbi:MAG: TfoX/Sxy family protein [Microthrixaceae bacterium]